MTMERHVTRAVKNKLKQVHYYQMWIQETLKEIEEKYDITDTYGYCGKFSECIDINTEIIPAEETIELLKKYIDLRDGVDDGRTRRKTRKI
jgi:hypothetical protein